MVFTVDTEPDHAWRNHLNPGVGNVRELLRFQRLLARYGARATLLVTSAVMRSDEARGILARLTDECGAEIGAHLHPWETPPFMPSRLDTRYATYPHELPLDVFEEKLVNLTKTIARDFDTPRCYRAGRWGLAAEHLPVLERLGYQVDTSVIPLRDWRRVPGAPRHSGGRGGVDYRFAPQAPYRPSYEDVTRPGGARILEIPVTVGFTRSTPAAVGRRYGLLPELLQRALRKFELLRPVWATPAEEPVERIRRMLAVVVESGARIINLALHSSELMVGGSPSTENIEATDEVFRRLQSLLVFLTGRWGCHFGTLADAARELSHSAAET
ncbi:MAG: hypothetical protein HRF43_05440 [Phycisphaerae bacterium]